MLGAWVRLGKNMPSHYRKIPELNSLPHFMTLACHDAQAIYDSIGHELGTFTQVPAELC